jgi:hypothetical protein
MTMAEPEQTYDDSRSRNLEQMLRELAARIHALDAEGRMLHHAAELMQKIGDIRSELFHYEVRATYDTPEVSESRRIVEQAKGESEPQWEKREWKPEEDEDAGW